MRNDHLLNDAKIHVDKFDSFSGLAFELFSSGAAACGFRSRGYGSRSLPQDAIS